MLRPPVTEASFSKSSACRYHSRAFLSSLRLASQRAAPADGQGPDLFLVATQDDGRGGGILVGQVPERICLVVAVGGQPSAVRADGQSMDFGLVATQNDGGGGGVLGSQVPQPRRLSALPVAIQRPSRLIAMDSIQSS